MRLPQEQRNRRMNYTSCIWLFILFLIFGVLAHATWGVYQKEKIARENRDAVEAKLLALEEKKITLDEALERLGTERGIEEEIREKFRVVKEGEQLVILLDENETATVRDAYNIDPRPWWDRLFDLFR